MTETTVYLVRHGQIDADVERRWFGSTDSSLNAKGQQQADRLASLFKKQYPTITASYSSPLKRTMSTAKGLTVEFYEPAKAHTTYRLTAFALHQKNAVYSALPAYPSSHDLG